MTHWEGRVATLTARCEALQTELTQVKGDAHGRIESRDREITELRERCEALEQGLEAKLHKAVARCDKAWEARCEALTAERDTFPQKLSETDENRVSFAAGYTAALDDALKGKTHD
jgi:chromosome segregation ATPase